MFEIFLLGLALAASPGPDFFLMTNHTLSGGRKLGFITLLGNRCSLLLHLTFALIGLSIILQQSATVFTSFRILGAIYLIYLGYNKLKNGWKLPKNTESPQRVTVTYFQAFKMGFLSNFLNPKVSLFFLSIFPQFLLSEQLAHLPLSVALVFLFGNSLWYTSVLWVIGIKKIRGAVQKFQYKLDLVFGFLFVIFGGKIIWEEIRDFLSNLISLTPSLSKNYN
jgi:threonine/homoserine/homoserine lactone efflux protein